MDRSDVLTLAGVALLSLLAFSVWPAAALGVWGAAFVAAGWSERA